MTVARAARRAALAAIAVHVACAAPDPGPLARVVSAGPSGVVAPDAVQVELTFSAPVDPHGLTDGRFLVLCRRDDLRAVSAAAEQPEGVAAGAPVVAARVTVSADALVARLAPAAPLEPGARWAAVLSSRARSASGRPVLDPEGRSQGFALLFETGPAADRAAPQPRWALPPHGPVPSNVAALRVAFDEPVEGALALGGTSAKAISVAPDLLGLDLEAPLAPGELAPSLAGVRDLAGNAPGSLVPLEVSACAAATAPPVGEAAATPGELSVVLEAALGGMGRLGVEVSAAAGEAACGAAPAAPATALALGEVLPCPGQDPCAPGAVACPGRVEVRGLCPGRTIRARLLSEDLAGHRSEPGTWQAVSAAPPRPAPVLTEALADADAPEAAGEYVEVANLGTGDADLTGFALAKRGTSGAFARCWMTPLAGQAVAPGAYALVVGGAYDGRYPLPAGTPLYRCGATALDGGLPNDRAVALALEDPLGQVVSTMGIDEPAPRCPAGALERVHPAASDTAANWACPGTRTPGACNRSTPAGECPRRPW